MSSTPACPARTRPASVLVIVTLALAALSGAGCRSSTAPRRADANLVRAVTAGSGLLAVTNDTGTPVFTLVVGGETAQLINWIPCVDARCAPIAPGATRVAAFSPTAPSGRREHVAIVYWWHAVPDGAGGARPDSVRAIFVTL